VTAIPSYRLDFYGLTDQRDGEPTQAVQFAVVDRGGERYQYGDQSWVYSGQAIEDSHPGGKIQRRTVTIVYGEWEDFTVDGAS
jgi:hypothetical protein